MFKGTESYIHACLIFETPPRYTRIVPGREKKQYSPLVALGLFERHGDLPSLPIRGRSHYLTRSSCRLHLGRIWRTLATVHEASTSDLLGGECTYRAEYLVALLHSLKHL
jgi:hypothetical protein